MFTLSDASKEVKGILKWGLIVIILISSAFAIFKIGLIVKEMLYPTPPPPPTVLFSKLPQIVFPSNATVEKLEFKIKTISGSLPQTESQISVYRIFTPKPDLLALDRIKQTAKKGKFNNGPYKVSETVYDFSTNEDLPKSLRINTEDFNFQVTSNYLQDENIISGRNIPDEKKAVEMAKDYFSSLGYGSTDLDFENPVVNMLSIENGGFVKATSLSNTKLVQVNFYKQNIDKLPVYNEKPTEANVNVIIAGGFSAEVVAASFINPEISEESSTYPLKTVEQAFEELKTQKAYIASYFGEKPEVSITDAFLAYYLSKNEKNYIMPIIIFVGDDGFYAYVSAVTDEWIGN